MITIIKWKDASCQHGWTDEKDVDLRLRVITTVGTIVDENDEIISVTDSYGCLPNEDGAELYNNIMNIPKVNIISRKDIEEDSIPDAKDNCKCG